MTERYLVRIYNPLGDTNIEETVLEYDSLDEAMQSYKTGRIKANGEYYVELQKCSIDNLTVTLNDNYNEVLQATGHTEV